MFANPLSTSSTDNALRQPQASVQADAAGGGLAGGLAAAAAGLLGTGAEGDPWLDKLIALDTAATMTPGADYVRLLYSWSNELPLELDKTLEVGLGYSDGGTQIVLKGSVHQFRQRINGTIQVTLCNGGAALAKLRLNQAYDQQNAGDVVADLAQRAGVDIDTAEAGIDLAYYVADDRSSAAEHLSALATACNFICYITPNNALYFGPANQSQAVKTFTYGNNLLQAWAQQSALPVTAVRAIGEGAAGSDGQDAWCWLAKQSDANTTDAGQGDAGRTLYSGAWRNADASKSAAAGHMAALQKYALTGCLVALGAPEVGVGNLIEITNAPQPKLNGEFLVTSVKHHFSKARGFTSEITFCELAAASGAGLLGGLF